MDQTSNLWIRAKVLTYVPKDGMSLEDAKASGARIDYDYVDQMINLTSIERVQVYRHDEKCTMVQFKGKDSDKDRWILVSIPMKVLESLLYSLNPTDFVRKFGQGIFAKYLWSQDEIDFLAGAVRDVIKER